MALLRNRNGFAKRLKSKLFAVFVIGTVVYMAILWSSNTPPAPLVLKREPAIEHIENALLEALKEDKGTGCDMPKLNPFAKEVMQFDKQYGPIVCEELDWVKCYMSKCKVVPEILETHNDVECTFRDIIYESDDSRRIGPPSIVDGFQEYSLNRSDHVKIACSGNSLSYSLVLGRTRKWSGHGIGFRSSVKPNKPPEGREDSINVLILGFDSTAKNGFIRKMPKSYEVLTKELGATVLNGYNIVGDATTAALFPILTGKTELELPEARKSMNNSGYVDQMPFIFYRLKEDGYRTAYFEDAPSIGTFQYRLNGFQRQPTDHYLRAFFMEDYASRPTVLWRTDHEDFCVGGTPRFQLMINVTDQFLKLDGKLFAFTFISDITHNDFNYIGAADVPTAEFLRGLKAGGNLKNTLLLVMGDHGPRFGPIRNTIQGKFEERLPLMAIRLPEVLKASRPEAQKALENNADVLTTPHDIHALILDAVGLSEYWNPYKVKGAELPRGITLLQPISRNRSCSEAGIEPQWCSCLKWDSVPEDSAIYQRVVDALVDHINSITEALRHKCALRTLSAIHWVMKRRISKEMLRFQGGWDKDNYLGKFGDAIKAVTELYQVKITLAPGRSIYEATVTHVLQEDIFVVNTREISRVNQYGTEPSCVSEIYPHLNKFCFCTS